MSQTVRCPACAGAAHYVNGVVVCAACEGGTSQPPIPPPIIAQPAIPRMPARLRPSNGGNSIIGIVAVVLAVGIGIGLIPFAWSMFNRPKMAQRSGERQPVNRQLDARPTASRRNLAAAHEQRHPDGNQWPADGEAAQPEDHAAGAGDSLLARDSLPAHSDGPLPLDEDIVSNSPNPTRAAVDEPAELTEDASDDSYDDPSGRLSNDARYKNASIVREVPAVKKAVLESADDPSSVSFDKFFNIGLVRCVNLDAVDYYAVVVRYRANNRVGAKQLMEHAVLFSVAEGRPFRVGKPVAVAGLETLQSRQTFDEVYDFLNPGNLIGK